MPGTIPNGFVREMGLADRPGFDMSRAGGRSPSFRTSEPWPGYDELTVSEIQSVLSEGDDDRAKQVRNYERDHKARAGVLQAAATPGTIAARSASAAHGRRRAAVSASQPSAVAKSSTNARNAESPAPAILSDWSSAIKNLNFVEPCCPVSRNSAAFPLTSPLRRAIIHNALGEPAALKSKRSSPTLQG